MAKTKAVAKVGNNPVDMLPLDSVPAYLQGKSSDAFDGFNKEDFKIPRVKLLQALNPEIKTFQGQAIPGEFWHTIANKSLGSEFRMVVIKPSKRVILWDANDGKQGGNILAFSSNALDWDSGAGQKFRVKLKGQKENVEWDTGRNVLSSGLLDWGSSNPEDSNSPPAAQLTYEYLCYLPDHPDLSPCVLGLFRTAHGNAKSFNSALLNFRGPTTSLVVRCFAQERTDGGNSWTIPKFQTIGRTSEELFKTCEALKERYADYKADYKQEDVTEKNDTSAEGNGNY